MSTFIEEICCSCGVAFGIPTEFHGHLKRNKQSFYCPNGHSMSYTKNAEDRLRERLDEEQKENRRLLRENMQLCTENKELKKKPKKAVKKKVAKKTSKKK